MSRKVLIQTTCSEKGYRDVKLNIDGGTTSSEDQVSILCTSISVLFVNTSSQSSLGRRQGSNAYTIIDVTLGTCISQHKLEVSLRWKQLPQLWIHLLINSFCGAMTYMMNFMVTHAQLSTLM